MVNTLKQRVSNEIVLTLKGFYLFEIIFLVVLAFDAYSTAEINRVPLDSLLLQMISMGLPKVSFIIKQAKSLKSSPIKSRADTQITIPDF